MSFARRWNKRSFSLARGWSEFFSPNILRVNLTLHAAYRCWHKAILVSIETELGLQVTFSISSETYFEQWLKEPRHGDLPVLVHINGAWAAYRENLLESLLVKLDDNVSAVNPRVSSLHYDTVFLLLKKTLPSRVAILFSIDLNMEKLYKSWREVKSIRK